MLRGYVAAISVRRSDQTRLEWFETKPLIASVGGKPLTGYGGPGIVEGYRCTECGTVIIR